MFPLRTFAVTAGLFIVSLVSAKATQLVVVEDSRCAPCIRFEKMVGQYYNATPQGRKAPLRRVNIANKVPADLANISINGPIRGTPTFLLIHRGRAVGMFGGFASADSFWRQLNGLLGKVSSVD